MKKIVSYAPEFFIFVLLVILIIRVEVVNNHVQEAVYNAEQAEVKAGRAAVFAEWADTKAGEASAYAAGCMANTSNL
ncbi:MAG: hypothetical protein COX81_01915 [Candidatus Magasanikbacteria bacterium CG_4_10_14_0_2_um_filter_37_12]|uniref:Uncharacterized protein n=1 Tax=Candidatus Magasanikbacteria bacterium CG_4_10_14_0_2_um_filter_37_12 TaxID=1974637 RepID=A0A2M7V8B6_9BACT|nr:MAG: hypothetical protein COX81_01915 [Candidatus Magasanikbacteria bacterium CG_4_10_14_0_2_um_filter_37_12]